MKKENFIASKKLVLIFAVNIFLILFISVVFVGLLKNKGDFFKNLYGFEEKEEEVSGKIGELYSISKGAIGNNWCERADINRDGNVDGLDVQILLASGLSWGVNCTDENNYCKYIDNGIEYNVDLSGDGRYDERDIQIINQSWQREDCAESCNSLSCEELGKNCGKWDDGCEDYVYCGDCGVNKRCTFNGLCENDICEGADINNDGEVSGLDIQAILALGANRENCSYPDWCNNADINRDGNVDELDIQKINASWQKTCIQNQTPITCINSCQEINKSGVYELCNDIIQYQYKDCIIIRDENVTLDCKGYSINSNLSIRGIYSNESYTTVKNCEINVKNVGIYLEESIGNEVESNNLIKGFIGLNLKSVNKTYVFNNSISFNKFSGIYITLSEDNQFVYNNLLNNLNKGIYLNLNHGVNFIKNNLIAYNNYGLEIYYSKKIFIENNSIYHNKYNGITIYLSLNNSINNNLIYNNTNYGIFVDQGSDCNFINNNQVCGNNLVKDFFCSDYSEGNYGSGNQFQTIRQCPDNWPVYGVDYSYCNESALFNTSLSLATLKEFYLVGEQINLTDPPESKNISRKDISYLKEGEIEELASLNLAKIEEFRKLEKLKKESEKIQIRGINRINPVIYIKKFAGYGKINLQEIRSRNTENSFNLILEKYNIPKEIQEELDEINKKNPSWIANYNSIFVKSDEYKKNINGLISNKSNAGKINKSDKKSEEDMPDFFDWRNQHGKNYITPIKDQGECGSCWAFGAVGALEGAINAYYNNPEINADLSEQDLVSCFHGSGCGGIETEFIGEIYNYFVLEGVANETCFSYTATNDECSNKCLNWEQGAWKTDFYESIELNKDAIKRALIEKGPVNVGMEVYSDFYSYSQGIYSHIFGLLEGYHAVTIVGHGNYDGKDYWIVKNSWGENWGEEGYFRIFAGDCGIDSRFAYVVKNPFYAIPKIKLCEDKDKDSYCNWGLGEKPSEGCPDCDDSTSDCDDSNSNIFNECGFSNEIRGGLNMTSSPSDAEVYVKDLDTGHYLYRGKTPLLINLNIGNREIKITKENYEDNYTLLEIRENETVNLILTLSPVIEFSEQITKNLKNQENPMISGNYIVWNDYRFGTEIYDKSIYVYDIVRGEEKQIKKGYIVGKPVISGNYVVYTDIRNGNSDIYLYNLTANEEKQITDDSHSQRYPSISGNYVVYADDRNGNSDIYLYDLIAQEEKQITTNLAGQFYPSISGNYIVWSDTRNGNTDIYMFDITLQEEKQITINPSDQINPSISGNYIVWSDTRNGNSNIYMYDIATNQEKQITFDSFDQSNPSISGNYIVWSDTRNGNPDIYLYDINFQEEKQILKFSSYQYEPSISGNYIVWSDDRNNFRVLQGTFPDHNLENYDIYFLDLSEEIKCSNNKRELLEECDGLDNVNCDGRMCFDNCKCLLPESKIVNYENFTLNGELKMSLQKGSTGGWLNVVTVFDKQISIPANDVLKLDNGKDNLGNQVFEGWNNLNVSALIPGNYRAFVKFENNEYSKEYGWKFEVV